MKKVTKQIKEKSSKKRLTKIDVLELDAICVNFLKTSGYGIAVDRKNKEFNWFWDLDERY